MVARRERPDNDPHEDMLDEVAERVFINYEPPQPEKTADDDEEEETGMKESAA